jgi:uncharacterized membrane protein YwaF
MKFILWKKIARYSVPKQMPQHYCPFSRYWCYLALKRRKMQIALFSSYFAAIGG